MQTPKKLMPFETLVDLEAAVNGLTTVYRFDKAVPYRLTKTQRPIYEEAKKRGYLTRGGKDEALHQAFWAWCEFSKLPWAELRISKKLWEYHYDLICIGKLEEQVGGEFSDRFMTAWVSLGGKQMAFAPGKVSGTFKLPQEWAHRFSLSATQYLQAAMAGAAVNRMKLAQYVEPPPAAPLPFIALQERHSTKYQIEITEEFQTLDLRVPLDAMEEYLKLAADPGNDLSALADVLLANVAKRKWQIAVNGKSQGDWDEKGAREYLRRLGAKNAGAMMKELRQTVKATRLAPPR